MLLAHNFEQIAGGVVAGIAVLWSSAHILRHLRWNKTKLWRCTARILVVVPIYALSAWGCLMLEDSERGWAELFTLTREGYEAVAIVSFMQFMLTFLKGPKHLAKLLVERGQAPFRHPWPLRLVLRPYQPGPHFVAAVVVGIMQYIPTMFIIFMINLSIWKFGEMDCCRLLHRMALLPKIAKAASCAFAMYNLVLFYHQTHTHLEHIRPVLKFMGIKGIVFFTFWQELVIALLVRLQVVPNPKTHLHNEWTQAEIADGIKNMLLCIEMMGFAELHRRAYPYDEFELPGSCLGMQSLSMPQEHCTEKQPGPSVLGKVSVLDLAAAPAGFISGIQQRVLGWIVAIQWRLTGPEPATASAAIRAVRIPQLFDLIELWSEVAELRSESQGSPPSTAPPNNLPKADANESSDKVEAGEVELVPLRATAAAASKVASPSSCAVRSPKSSVDVSPERLACGLHES
mmetsp:Transcript_24918/g.48541  ORF Transcript_24918/g.48541 Transcript_24918/m.48541 type:complete len:458 (+) Transcript_24918:111-1484(+)